MANTQAQYHEIGAIKSHQNQGELRTSTVNLGSDRSEEVKELFPYQWMRRLNAAGALLKSPENGGSRYWYLDIAPRFSNTRSCCLFAQRLEAFEQLSSGITRHKNNLVFIVSNKKALLTFPTGFNQR
ncbi:hypothetical protein O9992_14640 [Vibrio lentus]|nr:hypothetical protein [Vibrio lentus]